MIAVALIFCALFAGLGWYGYAILAASLSVGGVGLLVLLSPTTTEFTQDGIHYVGNGLVLLGSGLFIICAALAFGLGMWLRRWKGAA